MINDWLKIPYKPHGRDSAGCDCWGLVRVVREDLRGDKLASYGSIAPDSKHALTVAAYNVAKAGKFASVLVPQPGAIATVWRGLLCVHVGIVVDAEGRMAVLETTQKHGTRWMMLNDFQRAYLDVRFYDN